MQIPPFSLSKQISLLGDDLNSALLRVLQSGQYIGGEEVNTFEESFAASIGVPHVVGCNSGTDALVLALRALDIGAGDEVITSSFSFFATAEAISAVGAKPIFVEIDPRDYLIDLSQIEKVINSATKAILPVHLFGCPVDMEQLMALAMKNGLKVIEDCAQACGAKWQGRSVGSWGDIGCFSFFPTKNLGAAGDGGCISTQDGQLAQRIRELAIHGMPRRYLHTELGYNSRLDAIQAAVLNVKLPHLANWVKKRDLVAKRYLDALDNLPGVELPSTKSTIHMLHAWNQFVVSVKDISSKDSLSSKLFSHQEMRSSNSPENQNRRDWLKNSLRNHGVNTIIYYPIPIHLQPAYSELGYTSGSLPITERLCSEVLSLPIFPEITFEEQNYVIKVIKNLLA
ncbi:DegT/DnrJ/EryC1/StrS family aminotransferase [Prochlorococcus sp. MIT 1307]|uniref:DegT/DnrJ/EryC1/StrS family aminotransferase n=1 Tax=Prochlorococcus sp. MIT 1307 TaxID=3096219 RepID=UPI002A74902B|nr:DegT/DnrJ/EryC1/StrS family aminotransferase [Prochlorococcus sp. MIT 1307]